MFLSVSLYAYMVVPTYLPTYLRTHAELTITSSSKFQFC